jgi:hypothetical protein
MRAENGFYYVTPYRFLEYCWFSLFFREIFTHLPPEATYILYSLVAANFNN